MIPGVETASDEISASQEIHISADISFAMCQYLWATDIMANKSFIDVVFGIADFWISRLRFNVSRRLYDILSQFCYFHYAGCLMLIDDETR